MSGPGECRLVYRGFHQLELQRCGGSQIIIDGTARTLQESPPKVASRRPVDTIQYIYAKWDEKFQKVKLEASTTGHVNRDGIAIKKDDPSRTLVGMGRPYESRKEHFHWADTPQTKMFILSWYNRRPREFRCFPHQDGEVNSSEWEEISPSLQIEFLTWEDEAVSVSASGEFKTNGTEKEARFAVGFDGHASDMSIPPTDPKHTGDWNSFDARVEKTFPNQEGHHVVRLLGKVREGETLFTRGRVTGLTFSTLG